MCCFNFYIFIQFIIDNPFWIWYTEKDPESKKSAVFPAFFAPESDLPMKKEAVISYDSIPENNRGFMPLRRLALAGRSFLLSKCGENPWRCEGVFQRRTGWVPAYSVPPAGAGKLSDFLRGDAEWRDALLPFALPIFPGLRLGMCTGIGAVRGIRSCIYSRSMQLCRRNACGNDGSGF